MSSCLTLVLQRPPVVSTDRCGVSRLRCGGDAGRLRYFSQQQAAALGAPLLVHGVEQLDRLFVDQSPEVLEGDVLAALNTHLLQNLTQTLLALRGLQTGNGQRKPRGQ